MFPSFNTNTKTYCHQCPLTDSEVFLEAVRLLQGTNTTCFHCQSYLTKSTPVMYQKQKNISWSTAFQTVVVFPKRTYPVTASFIHALLHPFTLKSNFFFHIHQNPPSHILFLAPVGIQTHDFPKVWNKG